MKRCIFSFEKIFDKALSGLEDCDLFPSKRNMAQRLYAKCFLGTEQEFQELNVLENDEYEGIWDDSECMKGNISPHTLSIAYRVGEREERECFQLMWCFILDMSWSDVSRFPFKRYRCFDNTAVVE